MIGWSLKLQFFALVKAEASAYRNILLPHMTSLRLAQGCCLDDWPKLNSILGHANESDCGDVLLDAE